MRAVRVATLTAALLASTSVLAAAPEPFAGPWVGVGMGFRNMTSEITLNDGTDVNGIGKNNVYGLIQFGYGFNVHSADAGSWNLGPYVFYYPGNVSSTFTVPKTNASFDNTWKNQWGIGLQPGYFLTKDNVVYLKVGYNGITADTSLSNASGEVSQSNSFSGFCYGLGMKTQLSNNLLVFVEASQASYSSKTFNWTIGAASGSFEVKPKMVNASFGIGYQFEAF